MARTLGSVSWRFLRQPRWIVRHVAVALLIGAMVAAGLWQVRRHDDKRAYKDLVEARQEEPVAPVLDVLPPGAAIGSAAVDDVLYRSVRATGTYLVDDTVVVENRTLNGSSGAWVLTPLVVDDGLAVVVNRGFVGFDREGEIVPPAAPAGEVTVEGLVFPSQTRGRFGPTDPSEGRLEVLARADVERFGAQLDVDLLPAYVQAVATTPPEPVAEAGAPQLVALGPPTPDLGPHLSYAAQWAIFTLIAAVGYVLLLRRVARDQRREERAEEADRAVDEELADLLRTQP
jgi:cytochrome oxidase assembly protein ShyY1